VSPRLQEGLFDIHIDRAMQISELHLSVPNVYLLPDTSDQAEAPSIAGRVSMTVPTSDLPAFTGSLPRITVGLVRCVRIDESNSTPTRHREPVRQKLRFWKQPYPSSRTILIQHQTSRVQRQTIARNDICHAPDEISRHGSDGRTWLRFNFHVPLLANLVGSIDTVGSISYTVEVTVSPPAGGAGQSQLHVSRRINIVHSAIPRTIAHLRRYPGDLVTTSLNVTLLSTEKGISYALSWLARSTVSRGARESELKYVIAKELHWSIEETVKCVTIQHETTTCLHQYTRRLFEGRLKGRWAAPGGSQDGNDSIQIPFEVSIPRSIDVSDTTSLASYQEHYSTPALESDEEQLAVTVDHRLNLEVVTGEDTFHRGTGDLLDRRYPVKSFKATFPLLVRQHICEDFSTSSGQTREIPPVYGGPYTAPPGYEAS
jgi:hypothetical protein